MSTILRPSQSTGRQVSPGQSLHMTRFCLVLWEVGSGLKQMWGGVERVERKK